MTWKNNLSMCTVNQETATSNEKWLQIASKSQTCLPPALKACASCGWCSSLLAFVPCLACPVGSIPKHVQPAGCELQPVIFGVGNLWNRPFFYQTPMFTKPNEFSWGTAEGRASPYWRWSWFDTQKYQCCLLNHKKSLLMLLNLGKAVCCSWHWPKLVPEASCSGGSWTLIIPILPQ